MYIPIMSINTHTLALPTSRTTCLRLPINPHLADLLIHLDLNPTTLPPIMDIDMLPIRPLDLLR